MATKTINKPLSFRASALVLIAACLIVGTVEFQALKAKEPTARPPNKWSAAECVRCHSDPNSIQRMWEKEDGAHFLFNSDGTFKDTNTSGTAFRHPGREAIAKALQEWNASPRIGKTQVSR
jgi:hypothetical protein